MRIRKGDTVLVIAGKDRGKTGSVEHVSIKEGLVLVAGINIQKRHLKASRKNPKGGILEMPKPMSWAKVMVICSSCSKPSRMGSIETKAGKERMCKRCGKVISKQEAK